MITAINFKKKSFFAEVINFARKERRRVYLVGGYLRDLFLGRGTSDFDFAIDKRAIKFASSLSARLKGDFVVLDKKHGSARIILKGPGKNCTLDFTDLRGKDIKEDLFLRDFTINAMAVDILELRKAKDINGILLDPYGGRRDIKKKVIRVINNRAFSDDPLRILRIFSLSSMLKFNIDSKTLDSAKKTKEKIPSVSAERIREELFKILATAHAARIFKLMDDFFILDKVIPQIKIMRGVAQGPYHHLNVLEHSFETMAQIENLFLGLSRNAKINVYLDEVIAAGHSRRQVLKLAAFLHDIGKPDALTVEEGKTKFHGHEHIGRRLVSLISEQLKLSLKEKEAIKTIVLWHLRPGYLADNEDVTDRAIFRYFRDTGDEGASILLLSMADQRSTRGHLTCEENRKRHEKTCLRLIKEYFRRKEEKKIPRLITGNDLIKKLRLIPGPIFAKILEGIEEEQALGQISTKKEALELAGKIAKCQSIKESKSQRR